MDLEHFVTKPSIDQFLYIVIYVSWSRSVLYNVTVLLNRKRSGGTQVLVYTGMCLELGENYIF